MISFIFFHFAQDEGEEDGKKEVEISEQKKADSDFNRLKVQFQRWWDLSECKELKLKQKAFYFCQHLAKLLRWQNVNTL